MANTLGLTTMDLTTMKNRVAEYVPSLVRPFRGEGTEPAAGLNPKQWLESAEKLVREYPGAALAAAFAIGVTIAWFVKRK